VTGPNSMRGQIHWFVINRAGSTVTSDAHGRPVQTVVPVEVHGRIALHSAQQLANLGRFGENADAWCAVPRGTAISDADTVTASFTRIDGVTPSGIVDVELTGDWEVSYVEYNPAYLRVMLRKND
jgi:hypothetical protein